MPFGRLHEEAAGDGKLLRISDSAWRMWGMGLIYCQKNLTDGFIPADAIVSFGVKALKPAKVAEELCRPQLPGRAPLWMKVAGGYQIHDYLQWNDSRETILMKRQGAKSRLDRFRERQAADNGARNAVPTHSPDALPPDAEERAQRVRGSGDLSGRGSGGNQPSGVFAGALPREHLKHAACDPTFSLCVPRAVHDKLTNKLAPKYGGDRGQAAAALQRWYPTVWQSLAPDFVMKDEFKFWQGRFDDELATKEAKPSEARSTVPGVDATRAYLEER